MIGPKFTITVIDNDTNEIVIRAYSNGWSYDQSEADGDTLSFPEVFVSIFPSFDPKPDKGGIALISPAELAQIVEIGQKIYGKEES